MPQVRHRWHYPAPLSAEARARACRRRRHSWPVRGRARARAARVGDEVCALPAPPGAAAAGALVLLDRGLDLAAPAAHGDHPLDRAAGCLPRRAAAGPRPPRPGRVLWRCGHRGPVSGPAGPGRVKRARAGAVGAGLRSLALMGHCGGGRAGADAVECVQGLRPRGEPQGDLVSVARHVAQPCACTCYGAGAWAR